jgi:hypothetical protein
MSTKASLSEDCTPRTLSGEDAEIITRSGTDHGPQPHLFLALIL